MKSILVHPDIPGATKFREVLASRMSDFYVTLSLDNLAPEAVEVAVIWLSVPGYLRSLPNLKLVLVCGSGVDHIAGATGLPRDVRLVRLVDPYLRDHFSDYVVRAIQNHLGSREGRPGSQPSSGQEVTRRPAPRPTVGLMGLGLVGEATAKKLMSVGFGVCGWVRTSRPRSLSEVYVGEAELGAFARRCEVLVCQLPLTRQTRGILCGRLFDQLPRGAFLINVGRGGHLNEVDLLAAIESNKLSGACLDVFEVEPLPAEHPFRFHPKITVTPHVAGVLIPKQQALYAANVILNAYRGEVLAGAVDYDACY